MVSILEWEFYFYLLLVFVFEGFGDWFVFFVIFFVGGRRRLLREIFCFCFGFCRGEFLCMGGGGRKK